MKMLIGPIVFLTIVGGIASVADLKKVGLTGLKALTYFQIGTIIAMVFGLVAINLFRLGDGVNADASHAQDHRGRRRAWSRPASSTHWWDFLLRIVPDSVVGPFVEGEILQIIFLAVIFGVALNAVGSGRSPGARAACERLTAVVFKVLALHHEGRPAGRVRRDGVRRSASFGLSTLTSLGSLIGLFYATSALFVVVVLGSVMALPEAEHLPPAALPARGAPAHPRHLDRRAGPARPDAEAGARRGGEVHRRTGRPDRLLLQPRRRRHLPVPGRPLHRPGHQHRPDHRPAARTARRSCCSPPRAPPASPVAASSP